MLDKTRLEERLYELAPKFQPPLRVDDYIRYRQSGIFKLWFTSPRLGRIWGINEEQTILHVEYPSTLGFKDEVISIFQIINHYPMDEDNESESNLP